MCIYIYIYTHVYKVRGARPNFQTGLSKTDRKGRMYKKKLQGCRRGEHAKVYTEAMLCKEEQHLVSKRQAVV